jgi:hypothetical protein
MNMGPTQPLTEMSTRNLPGGKRRQTRNVDLTTICEHCESLDVSRPYGLPRPVTVIALTTISVYLSEMLRTK